MTGSFQQVLSAAIADLLEHGFDSIDRVARWSQELRAAAERSFSSGPEMDLKFRDALSAIYRRLIDRGEILRTNQGIPRFTIDRVRPALRAELDRRIVAAASLVKLNRQEAVEKVLRRFEGWSTSIPKGGTDAENKRKRKQEMRKSIAGLPFLERRVIIDQGHKLVSSLNEILASDGGAIAGRWSSRWRQPGYNYREDHKERDKKVYLVRNSWAHKAGLVKPGAVGYYDEITAAGQEVNCRCSVVWLYNLRDLPREMLTDKGKKALASVQGQEEVRSARTARADAGAKQDKWQAKYRGPYADRPHGERCDECTMFRGPLSCSAVSGVIDPGGWCKLFERALVLSSMGGGHAADSQRRENQVCP
jgi:hypothetical protein